MRHEQFEHQNVANITENQRFIDSSKTKLFNSDQSNSGQSKFVRNRQQWPQHATTMRQTHPHGYRTFGTQNKNLQITLPGPTYNPI